MDEEMHIENSFGMDIDKNTSKNNIIQDLINTIESTNISLAITAADLIKNKIIGSDRKKAVVIYLGIFARLSNILKRNNEIFEKEYDTANSLEYISLEIEALQILTSLAKISKVSYSKNMENLFNSDMQLLLINNLKQSHSEKIIEVSLCCLHTLSSKSLLNYGNFLKKEIIKDIPKKLIQHPKCIESFIGILAKIDLRNLLENFDLISGSGILDYLLQLLNNSRMNEKIHENVLAFLIKISSIEKPHQISHLLSQVGESKDKNNIPDPLILFDKLQYTDRSIPIQLNAAKCIANVFRATVMSGTIFPCLVPPAEVCSSSDSLEHMVIRRTLPTLVRMCLPGKATDVRVEGTLALANLIETHPDLQMLASYSNQLLAVISEFVSQKSFTEKEIDPESPKGKKIKTAVLRLYAALSSNHESIRKKLIDSHNLMDHVLKGLTDTDERVRYAAILCLLSLSRSVQLLRTSFQDTTIWKIVLDSLRSSRNVVAAMECDTGDQDGTSVTTATHLAILNACLAICCNLLLEFSPAKESLINQSCIIADLGNIIKDPRQDRPFLTAKLNALWCLLNMTFRCEEGTKRELIAAINFDSYLMPLVRKCAINFPATLPTIVDIHTNPDSTDLEQLMAQKVVGILRNMCSPKCHLPTILPLVGMSIIQDLTDLIASPFPPDILKEGAICVLINVAQAGLNTDEVASGTITLPNTPTDPRPLTHPESILNQHGRHCDDEAAAANFLLATAIGSGPGPTYEDRGEQRTLESLIACAKEMAAAANLLGPSQAPKALAHNYYDRDGDTMCHEVSMAYEPPSPRTMRIMIMDRLKYSLALREDTLRALIECSLYDDQTHQILKGQGEPVYIQDEEMVSIDEMATAGVRTPGGGNSNASKSEDSSGTSSSSEDNKDKAGTGNNTKCDATTSCKGESSEAQGAVTQVSGLSYTVSILTEQKRAASAAAAGCSNTSPPGLGGSRSGTEFSRLQRAALRCLNTIYAPKAIQKINGVITSLTQPLLLHADAENPSKKALNLDFVKSLHWKILSQVLDDALPADKSKAFITILTLQLFPPDEEDSKTFLGNVVGGASDILVDTSKESLRNLAPYLTWRKGQRSRRNSKSRNSRESR